MKNEETSHLSEPIVNVEAAATLQLAQTKIINEIRRVGGVCETRFDALNMDQRKQFIAELLNVTNEPTLIDVNNLIYPFCKEHGVVVFGATSTTPTDKAARRKERRQRRKQQMTDENGNPVAKAPVVRGGANTLVLQDANNPEQIFRFKVRKKGGPKYETTSTDTTIVKINGEDVTMVFNPAEGTTSNRTGFRFTKAGQEESAWFILDDADAYAFFHGADDGMEFTILEATVKAEEPTEGGEPKVKKAKKSKKSESTEPVPEATEEPAPLEETEEPVATEEAPEAVEDDE